MQTNPLMPWLTAFEDITELIPVPSLGPVPDPNWSSLCPGHSIHAHVAVATPEGVTYPTLEWVVIEEADDDEPEEGYYRCRTCAAVVEPGLWWPGSAQVVRGPTTYAVLAEYRSEEGTRTVQYRFGPDELAAAQTSVRVAFEQSMVGFVTSTSRTHGGI